MSEITKVAVDVLKVHPRNQEFFDDISGNDYEQFKSSIKEDGIIAEIIVAPDMTILSGHQRYKAALELGLTTVPIRIREDVETEEQKLKILLASNFGRKENDKAKQRKIAVEYVALCGNSHGGDRKSRCQNGTLNLDEIAAQLGTNKRSLQRSLKIERDLSEPMKQLLEDGVISETVAADIITGLSEEQQLSLVASLDATKKYTANEIKDNIKQLDAAKEENKQLHQKVDELGKRNLEKAEQIKNLKSQLYRPLQKTKVEYETEEENKKIEDLTDQNEILYNQVGELTREQVQLNKKIAELESQLTAKDEELSAAKEEATHAKMSIHSKEAEALAHSNIIGSLSKIDVMLKHEVASILDDGELETSSDFVKKKVEKVANQMISLGTQLIKALDVRDVVDVDVI